MNDDINNRQVAGAHYKSAFQHWDWVAALKLPYMPAQVSKYLCRWRRKNGLQDLEKAEHFLAKFILTEGNRQTSLRATTDQFCKENQMADTEVMIIRYLVDYQVGDLSLLIKALSVLREIIVKEKKNLEDKTAAHDDQAYWDWGASYASSDE